VCSLCGRIATILFTELKEATPSGNYLCFKPTGKVVPYCDECQPESFGIVGKP
jgi:hypothetical protein